MYAIILLGGEYGIEKRENSSSSSALSETV